MGAVNACEGEPGAKAKITLHILIFIVQCSTLPVKAVLLILHNISLSDTMTDYTLNDLQNGINYSIRFVAISQHFNKDLSRQVHMGEIANFLYT